MSTAKETGIDIHRAADRGTFRDVCKYVEMGGDVNARDKSQVRKRALQFSCLSCFRSYTDGVYKYSSII